MNRKSFLILALIGLLGSMALLYATPRGIGMYDDSVKVVSSARSLLAGRGIAFISPSGKWTPLAGLPPLYPILLASLGLAGVEPLQGARWLSAFCLGATALLVGLMTHKQCQGDLKLSILGAILFLSSEAMLAQYVVAYTEPPFFLLAFAGLYLLALYLENPRRKFLLASAACLSLASLTRWAAPPFIATAVLGLLVLEKSRLARRVGDILILGLVTGLPTGILLLRNLLTAGTAADRMLEFHGFTLHDGRLAVSFMSRWFMLRALPEALSMALFIGAGLGLCVLWLWLRRRARNAAPRPEMPVAALPTLMLILIIGYSAFLVLTVSLFDAAVIWGDPDRALSPLFIPMLLLILFVAHKALQGPYAVRIGAACCCILFAVFSGRRAVIFLRHSRMDGRGYNETQWNNSSTIAKVQGLPQGTRIVTNNRFAIYLLAGRLAGDLPAHFDIIRRKPVEDWPARVRVMGKDLCEHGGVIVLFGNSRGQDMTEAELTTLLKLRLIAREDDGVIYGVDSVTQPSTP